MQALLDMPNPNASLNSLHLFYDTIATHTRALASLGKSKESYGDLLVSEDTSSGNLAQVQSEHLMS